MYCEKMYQQELEDGIRSKVVTRDKAYSWPGEKVRKGTEVKSDDKDLQGPCWYPQRSVGKGPRQRDWMTYSGS